MVEVRVEGEMSAHERQINYCTVARAVVHYNLC